MGLTLEYTTKPNALPGNSRMKKTDRSSTGSFITRAMLQPTANIVRFKGGRSRACR